MDKLAHGFYRVLLALACLAMLAAFGAVLLGIVSRLLRFNVPGLDAYAGYAIAAALFLALPVALREGEHIRVTLVLDRVPARVRGALEWWSLLAGLALALGLSVYAARLVWFSYVTHDLSTAADASPLWVPQLPLLMGSVGLTMAFVHALVARWHGQAFVRKAASQLVD